MTVKQLLEFLIALPGHCEIEGIIAREVPDSKEGVTHLDVGQLYGVNCHDPQTGQEYRSPYGS